MVTPDIVLDTNVIIAAQRSRRGASAKLMTLVGTGRFNVHLSVPLVLEYEDVLRRQSDTLGLTQQDVTDLVDGLCTLGHHHEIYFLWRPRLRDPKDEFILELAVAGRCSHIVTFNQRDFVGMEEFGITVMSPREFLEEIGEIK